MSNYLRSITVAKSSIDIGGNCTVPKLVGSDPSLAVTVTDSTITVTVIDAALGKIRFSSKPGGFGNIEIVAIQDTQWPDGAGVFTPTPHPITLGEVAQIDINKTDLGHLKDEIEDADTGLIKKVADLTDNKVDKDGDKVLSDKNFTADLETKLNNLESPLNLGYYDTLAELQTDHPSPREKSFGYVKTTVQGEYKLYVFEGSAYSDKGVIGGSVTLEQIKGLIDSDTSTSLVTDEEASKLTNLPAFKSFKTEEFEIDTNGMVKTSSDVLKKANIQVSEFLKYDTNAGKYYLDETSLYDRIQQTIDNDQHLREGDFQYQKKTWFAKDKWVTVDANLELQIYDTKKAVKFKYSDDSLSGMPDEVTFSGDFTVDLKDDSTHEIRKSGVVLKSGDSVRMTIWEVDGWWDKKLDEKGDGMKGYVRLTAPDGRSKLYHLTITSQNDDDKNDKYRLKVNSITGNSLSNDPRYNY